MGVAPAYKTNTGEKPLNHPTPTPALPTRGRELWVNQKTFLIRRCKPAMRDCMSHHINSHHPQIPLEIPQRGFGVEAVGLHFFHRAIGIDEGLAEIFLED